MASNTLKRGMIVQVSGRGKTQFKIVSFNRGGLSEDEAVVSYKADGVFCQPHTESIRLSNVITRKDPCWMK